MIYKNSDICVCGCQFNDHDDMDEWCYGCFYPPSNINCQQFQLDNLRYVEDEAKARKLI